MSGKIRKPWEGREVRRKGPLLQDGVPGCLEMQLVPYGRSEKRTYIKENLYSHNKQNFVSDLKVLE
jgi:hypothetical protein